MNDLFEDVYQDSFLIHSGFLKIVNNPTDAVFLSYLIDYQKNLPAELQSSDWFSITVQHMKNEICLTYDQQLGCCKRLQKMGLIDVRQMGMPATRHFKLNRQAILDLVKNCY